MAPRAPAVQDGHSLAFTQNTSALVPSTPQPQRAPSFGRLSCESTATSQDGRRRNRRRNAPRTRRHSGSHSLSAMPLTLYQKLPEATVQTTMGELSVHEVRRGAWLRGAWCANAQRHVTCQAHTPSLRSTWRGPGGYCSRTQETLPLCACSARQEHRHGCGKSLSPRLCAAGAPRSWPPCLACTLSSLRLAASC